MVDMASEPDILRAAADVVRPKPAPKKPARKPTTDIEDRIVEVWRDATGARPKKRRGAKTWFAQMVGVTPSTVTRWCRGEGVESAEGYVNAYWTGRRIQDANDGE